MNYVWIVPGYCMDWLTPSVAPPTFRPFHITINIHVTSAVDIAVMLCYGARRNIHPLTPFLFIVHPLSTSSICYDPLHPLGSVYVLDSPLRQPLSRSSLVFLLALDPQLHTSCISSPSHHLLFAAHAHAIAVCSAVIPVLCHLYIVSLSTPYLGVCLLA